MYLFYKSTDTTKKNINEKNKKVFDTIHSICNIKLRNCSSVLNKQGSELPGAWKIHEN